MPIPLGRTTQGVQGVQVVPEPARIAGTQQVAPGPAQQRSQVGTSRSQFRNISTRTPTPSSMPVVPVAGVSLSDLVDTFGASRGGGSRSHKGIDIFADNGTPTLAAAGGKVVKTGWAGLGGLRVWIRDASGHFHYYAHLSRINVKPGQSVAAGQMIGRVGNTGNAKSTPPHLHYSVNPNSPSSEDGSFNPFQYLKRGGAATMQVGGQDGGGGDPRFFDSTTQFQRADLTLPSDDFGDLPMDGAGTGDPDVDFQHYILGVLDQVSHLMAGGERVPVNELPDVPIDENELTAQQDDETPDTPGLQEV